MVDDYNLKIVLISVYKLSGLCFSYKKKSFMVFFHVYFIDTTMCARFGKNCFITIWIIGLIYAKPKVITCD